MKILVKYNFPMVGELETTIDLASAYIYEDGITYTSNGAQRRVAAKFITEIMWL